MPKKLYDLLPDPDVLLAQDIEAMGRLILQTEWRFFDREAFVSNSSSGYPRDHAPKIEKLVSKGWTWLKNQGYLDQDPSQRENILMITDEGRDFMLSAKASSVKQRIQKGYLHQAIEETSYVAYHSGRYRDAINNAYIEIEIRVRSLSGAPAAEVGVKLMNRAFASPAGPLTDPTIAAGEQAGFANLFAGAFGCIRNRAAHQNVDFASVETAEFLFLASLMMRKLDEAERRLNSSNGTP